MTLPNTGKTNQSCGTGVASPTTDGNLDGNIFDRVLFSYLVYVLCFVGPDRRRLCSWLAKMDLVKQMLVDEASPLPKLDALACAYIYLQVRGSSQALSRST